MCDSSNSKRPHEDILEEPLNRKLKVDKETTRIDSSISLTDLHLDTLWQIFGYLDYNDILTLGRVSKRLNLLFNEYLLLHPRREFQLGFSNVAVFKQWVDNLSGVISWIPFQVHTEETFKGISVYAMNECQMFLVDARLDCNVRTTGKTKFFYLDRKPLMSCLNTLDPKSSLIIYQGIGEEDIYITAFNEQNTIKFKLKNSNNDYNHPPVLLEGLEYDYSIALHIGQLSSVLNLAHQLNEQKIYFSILELDSDPPTELPRHVFRIQSRVKDDINTFSKDISTLTMAKKGNGYILDAKERSIHSIPPQQLSSLKTKYTGIFSRVYLSYALKNIQKKRNRRKRIEIRLSSGMPLWLDYSISTQSFIKFILAERIDD